MPANGRAARADGQCSREQTADGNLIEPAGETRSAQARVKRWCKRPPACRVTGVAR